uniref:Capsid protein VP1 n=1 Tax=Calicivirus isolate Geel 2008/Belgium TaxID=673765 RepID=C9E9G1_9CALI|nr:capsid protein precursor [Calicivirus isolate Geel 2008/Belgium]
MARSSEYSSQNSLDEVYDYDTYDPFPNFERNLASYYSTDFCPRINLEDFFLDPEDFDFCDHPFECCFPDYLDSLGTEEYIYEGDEPYIVLKHQLESSTFWEDGSFTYPILPPFKTSSVSYFMPKAGEVLHRCLMAVAKGMDPSLQVADRTAPTLFRAESGDASSASPDITGEEQGVVVATGTQPSAPAMATLATAATGTMPEEWKTFFSYYTTVNWSTTDETGKVLFVQGLSPRMNPFLDHLAKMYTGWSGSMELRFTISGSGVFGGKVAAVMVPPGIGTEGGTSLLQFPHVLVDARQTEPVIFNIPDIRTVLWHDMHDTTTAHLVILVYNDLLNPYQSVGQGTSCTITVETRGGQDFEFHLLKPPSRKMIFGADPSKLIPKKSMFWEGNRLPGKFLSFTIKPIIFQANRHFDCKRQTFGWSTPEHRGVALNVKQENLDKQASATKDIGIHSVFGLSTIKSSIPDGWPDYYGSRIVTQNTVETFGNVDNAMLGTVVPYNVRGKLDWKHLPECAFANGTATNSTIVCGKNLTGNFYVVGNFTQNGNIIVSPAFWTSRNGDNMMIGEDEDMVKRIDVLPQAQTTGGNYPLSYITEFPCAYLSAPRVMNSQLLWTSRMLAQDVYDIGPEALAVFKIKDSAGNWFDIGISSEGFSFVGASQLPFSNLQFPLEASYVGMASAYNKLQHNIAGTSTVL